MYFMLGTLPEDERGTVVTYSSAQSDVMVIGVGTLERGDDAAGRLVARRVEAQLPDMPCIVREMRGEAAELMDAWAPADTLILIDAAITGAKPGNLRRYDASHQPLPAELARTSSHDMGVSDAIELARAMGMLPRKVIVYTIEIGGIALGSRLSLVVQDAIRVAAQSVIHEAQQLIKARQNHA